MQRGIGLRGGRWALLVACWMVAPASFAYKATFEGLLISSNPVDAAIPIILNLDISIAGVSGDVTTALPLQGQGVVIGDEAVGTCNVRSLLSGAMVLKMKGTCGVTSPIFEGKYSLLLKDGKKQAGSFRLAKTRARKDLLEDGLGGSDRRSTESSRLTTAQCINSHGVCLLSCPRGDYNAEFLCANRCKKKLNACKSRAGAAR